MAAGWTGIEEQVGQAEGLCKGAVDSQAVERHLRDPRPGKETEQQRVSQQTKDQPRYLPILFV